MQPERWVVVWFSPERREALFQDRALAEAYAAAHRGVVVPMAALGTWPVKCAGDSSQHKAQDDTTRL